MTKASDNVYPRLLISEGGSTATPAAARVTVYAKSDGLLYSKDDAGTETPLGGGGGDITTDVAWAALGDLIVGTGPDAASILTAGADGLVLTTDDGEATGLKWAAAGSSTSWSPDTVPASPHADDDEFDALSGWTTLGSLDTLNVTDFDGFLHMRKNTSGDRYDGIYKASPSVPYTVTMKVADRLWGSNYQFVGLMILDATPAKLFAFGVQIPSATASWQKANVGGARSSFSDVGYGQRARYIRLVVTSGSDVTTELSVDGFLWETIHANIDSGLTPTKVGIVLWTYSAVADDAVIDYIRFA